MAQLKEIIQLGNPLLRETARVVDDLDSVRHVISDMHELLAGSNGVGLAAPQIGESWRIVIVASRPSARYPKAPLMDPEVMINPVYEVIDRQLDKDWEGCLSIPGIRALVPRYRAIRINYLNGGGKPCEATLQDFVARIFQHEYDHLDGKVYLDRVENNRDIVAESEYLKLFKT